MNIKKSAEKYEDYIIERRRYYHQYPEITLEEKDTTEALIKDLHEMGITDIKRFEKGWYGFVATITGGKPGKTVMLRSDIDALPVKEETNLPFSSKNIGKMHACGHDAHMAMLLGAAKILQEIKEDISGTVKLMFQPAEEWGIGAPEAISQGFLIGVDAIYGTHVWADIPTGTFNFENGDRMAGAGIGKLTVKGVGAHGSAPHLGHDAIVAASAIVMAIQSIVSRMNNPLKPLVVGVGTIHGGLGYNIIPSNVEMDLTIRYYDVEIGNNIERIIRKVAENMAKAYGCQAIFEYGHRIEPVSNQDESLIAIAQNAVKKLYGEDALVPMTKLTSSEDYAFFMGKVPGIFGFAGIKSADVPGSEKNNHNQCFTVDERMLSKGAAVAAQFAYDYLKDNTMQKKGGEK
ncbi:MAG: amidohydrolase [Fusobacteriaceae bacterium]|jgi:amidohydrolase|nr:amidohydrolase [Fusobacteriaceae bacterium]